jgi:hypothetical protein
MVLDLRLNEGWVVVRQPFLFLNTFVSHTETAVAQKGNLMIINFSFSIFLEF